MINRISNKLKTIAITTGLILSSFQLNSFAYDVTGMQGTPLVLESSLGIDMSAYSTSVTNMYVYSDTTEIINDCEITGESRIYLNSLEHPRGWISGTTFGLSSVRKPYYDSYEGEKYEWVEVHGARKMSGVSSLNTLGTSNEMYGYVDDTFDEGTGANDIDYLCPQFAIKINGLKDYANGRSVLVSNKVSQPGVEVDWSQFDIKVVPNSVDNIFPEKYPDMIYAELSDIKKMIPWYDKYEIKKNESDNTVYMTMDNKTSTELYNQYQGTEAINYLKVNDKYEELIGIKHKFLSRSITRSSYLKNGTYYDFLLEGTLEDNVSTKLPTGVHNTVDKEKDETGTTTWIDVGIDETENVISDWEVSDDKQKWYTLCTGTNTKDFKFDMRDHSFIIERKGYDLPEAIKDSKTLYIRRKSSATSVMASYNNVYSPPMKIRTTLALEDLKVAYDGPAVIQGLNFDTKNVKITAKYTDSDTPTIYKGNQPFIEYSHLEIYNIGNNNYIRYTYEDPRTGDIKTGEFTVPGKLPEPLTISATYQGDPVVEDMPYNPAHVRIQITYNNGTISTYMGSSLSVGITNKKDYQKSDVDLNTVVNSNDLAMLNRAMNGETLSDKQRAQADINGDGVIDNKDYQILQTMIDRVIPLGGKKYYASYVNLFEDKTTGKMKFAEFTIPAEKKKPYKLIVTMQPLKKNYIKGEDFDPTGMVLNVFYNNGSTKVITFADKDETFDGLKLGNEEFPSKNMKTTQTKLPISYTENGETVETILNLSVKEKTLTSLKITNPPDTVIYYSGENFNRTGMEVTAYYDEMSVNHQPTATILGDRDYDVDNEKRLPDSRDYVLIQADDPNAIETGYLKILKSKVISPADLSKGTHGTFTYNSGGANKTITGTIVGNHAIYVSYTDRGVTKTAIQPVDVLERKLVSVAVEQMPYKTTYTTGDTFDATGLILRATYTDGSREFIYQKTADRNGYEAVNPSDLTPERKEITIEYTENGFKKDTVVPITVNDPALEDLKAIYIGENVYTNSDFDPHNVIITATYNNGRADAFRGDDRNADGTRKFTFFNESGIESLQVTKIGENKFTVPYGGLTAEFIVIGVKRPDQIDFSGSVAKSKRKWAMWEEEFRAIKIKSVADYINGSVNDLNIDTITEDEYHVVEKTKVTEDRAVLTEYNGTARIQNLNDASITTSPMLNFMREGTWRQPETEISVEYKARTRGYLFPEAPNPRFASDYSYLEAYNQDIPVIWNGDDGWSDWYRNGDSAGSVYADRIAYRYDMNANPVTDSETMYLDRLKIRLTGAKEGDNPMLNVTMIDTDGATHTYDRITEDITINKPSKIMMTLSGQITVTDDNSNPVRRDFADVYKVYYRTATDELVNWSESGEWAGTDGIQMQNIEIRLMLKEADFDKGSVSERPIFSQHPKNVSAIIGDKVVFTSSAVGQTLTYQWYKDGVAIPGANSASYRTPEVTAADNETHYWVEVSNGMYTAVSSKALLKVNDVFPIITQNPENIEGQVGDVVEVSVAATCKDPSVMHYTWEIRNGAAWELLPGTQDTANLLITLNENLHGKDIRCKITNSRGYTYTNAARINCSKPPEIELKANAEYVIASKQNVRFNANVIASSGNATFQWIVDDIQQNVSSSVFNYKPETIGDHEIRCIITDKYGTGEDSIILHVGDIPDVELTDTIKKETDGTSTLSVNAKITEYGDGDETTIEWRVDGKLLEEKGNVLTLPGLKSGDQYAVVCTVSNEFGSNTKVLNVLIKEEG